MLDAEPPRKDTMRLNGLVTEIVVKLAVVLDPALALTLLPIPLELQFAVAFAAVPAYHMMTTFVAFVNVPEAAVALTLQATR